jgi:hypothetical protein
METNEVRRQAEALNGDDAAMLRPTLSGRANNQ